MAAFFASGIGDQERGYQSDALRSGFGASFNICSDELAQQVVLVKLGAGWSHEALPNQRQSDWMERNGLKFESAKLGLVLGFTAHNVELITEEEKGIILPFAKKVSISP